MQMNISTLKFTAIHSEFRQILAEYCCGHSGLDLPQGHNYY